MASMTPHCTPPKKQGKKKVWRELRKYQIWASLDLSISRRQGKNLCRSTQEIRIFILENSEPHAICAGPEWADGESSSVGFLFYSRAHRR